MGPFESVFLYPSGKYLIVRLLDGSVVPFLTFPRLSILQPLLLEAARETLLCGGQCQTHELPVGSLPRLQVGHTELCPWRRQCWAVGCVSLVACSSSARAWLAPDHFQKHRRREWHLASVRSPSSEFSITLTITTFVVFCMNYFIQSPCQPLSWVPFWLDFQMGILRLVEIKFWYRPPSSKYQSWDTVVGGLSLEPVNFPSIWPILTGHIMLPQGLLRYGNRACLRTEFSWFSVLWICVLFHRFSNLFPVSWISFLNLYYFLPSFY